MNKENKNQPERLHAFFSADRLCFLPSLLKVMTETEHAQKLRKDKGDYLKNVIWPKSNLEFRKNIIKFNISSIVINACFYME